MFFASFFLNSIHSPPVHSVHVRLFFSSSFPRIPLQFTSRQFQLQVQCISLRLSFLSLAIRRPTDYSNRNCGSMDEWMAAAVRTVNHSLLCWYQSEEEEARRLWFTRVQFFSSLPSRREKVTTSDNNDFSRDDKWTSSLFLWDSRAIRKTFAFSDLLPDRQR